MRINMKGIHRVKKKLSDGTTAYYYYAWRNGPRIKGQPGSDEFTQSYYELVSAKKKPDSTMLQSVLNEFQDTTIWADLAPRTQQDYIKQIKVIEKKFGSFPINGLADIRTKAVLMKWRDELAKKSRRQADYAWQVLARILSWALPLGKVPANPCEKGGRVYRGNRSENVWASDDESAFMALAPAHLHLALQLALWTGQRQGDLLRLEWPAYDGTKIRLKQSKTGARVVIPVGAPLKIMLDAIENRTGTILKNLDGEAWTSDGFRTSWRKARIKSGVSGLTFNDLRGTAVTRLALAECTEAEIATITGHSLRDVRSILDAHYLNRDPKLAESAIRKLENKQKSVN